MTSRAPAIAPGPRFAAIDTGSNAIRLKVVEARSPGAITVLQERRFPVRLGHEVFQTGHLAPRSMRQAEGTFRTIRRVLAAHGVTTTRVRAVATSAVRDARNGMEFCERVERETGIRIERISGAEEARLVRLALRRALDLTQRRAILFDLGGGSLEITVVIDGEAKFSTSLEVGTVRVLEAFLTPTGPVSREEELVVVEFIDRALLPVLPQVRQLAPNVAAGVGGNFEALAALCPATDGTVPAIQTAKLDDLLEQLTRRTAAQRRKRFGLRPDRADVIVPATYIVRRLAQVFDVRRIAVPGAGLRDGLLYQQIDQAFGVWDYTEEAVEIANAARNLGRRYQFDEAHAEQTERMALRLFDDLKALHQLGREEREMLRLAAILHDVGTFISAERHHRHSYYIIANSELGGLPAEKREMIARVARFHRKAVPSASHVLLADYSKKKQELVVKLAGLLRLADALDREHRRAVSDVRARVAGARVVLRILSSGDLPALELWTVRSKAELFEKTFGKKLSIERD